MTFKLTPRKILKTLNQCIGEMQSNIEKFVKRPGKDFSRPAICTFPVMLKATMAMESHDIDKEILQILPAKKTMLKRKDLVTQSAFNQARDKFNQDAFPFLFKEFNRKNPLTKTRDGLYVWGLDGSDVNIPFDIKDCNSHIPYNSNNGCYDQWHLNLTYDLLNERYMDIVIQPRVGISECVAACDMVDRKDVNGKCLYIADRGYLSFNLMAHIMEKGDFFLIRVKEPHSVNSPFKLIVPNGENESDKPHEFVITRNKKMAESDPVKYKYFKTSQRFDFIPEGDQESEYRIPFRFICIKLDNGTIEYLVTNLSADKYPVTVMKEYYHLRWGIEISFLFLKYGVALNYFHSVKREFLEQEVYAKLIFFNFISMVVSCVEVKKTNTKYDYKISFSDAINTGRLYLLGRVAHCDVVELLLMHKSPVRPDRAYKRDMRSQRLRPLNDRS